MGECMQANGDKTMIDARFWPFGKSVEGRLRWMVLSAGKTLGCGGGKNSVRGILLAD